MGIFDFVKKKNEEIRNQETREAHEAHKSEITEMLGKIYSHLRTDFQGREEKADNLNAFYKILEKEVKKHVGKQKREQLPVDALSLFYVSADCMNAYVCILPPLNNGKGIDEEYLLDDMRYEGIVSGIDQDAVAKLLSSDNYLRIIQIARGTYPEDGVDGKLEEFYDRRCAQTPELDKEEMLNGQDFRKKNVIQTIREGEILCRITPPVPAKSGVDVSGTILYGKKGEAVRIPQGKHTTLSEDGLTLRSDISGIVVMENDNFSIQSQRVLEQDVNAGVGDLQFDGDIYIKGNVEDGVTIQATGNVMIIGDVRDGRIISGGTICIQGSVKGSSRTQLDAARQIQCMLMENATATAIGDIYSGVIANSNVFSERGSVFAMMGRGLIFGGSVTSGKSVYAKKIGNISGCDNHITLGLVNEFERRRRAINDELEEINRALEHLRKNISDMQISGRSHRNESQKEYNDLVNQRTTYGELKREKLDELDEMNRLMRSIHPGSILCEDIYPITIIAIDKQLLTIHQKESDCNIRLRGGQIVLN